MKKFSSNLSFVLLAVAIYYAFYSLMPQSFSKAGADKVQFSTERALMHVRAISKAPHFVGTEAHSEVRQYLISELRRLGLDTQVQEGYTPGDWGNFSKVYNIIAKVEGTENNKSLMLLSHYDSNPHSSLGASDDGSGVATILEGVRALLARGEKPKNDIIILFTDAEELGLNGAQLFVNEHPWAKQVGLVLNFEARGSGGPSYMLIETNRGNSRLIEHFAKAAPKFPVANSLMYSIYKMLPNDTDLTVFREDGNIEGFNFAFIDDHYDYHTVLDSYDRLDRNTLEHQGSYLMPLLNYFGNENLNNLKTDEDNIYFNFPFFRFVSYPFSWIFPMLFLAIAAFILLLIVGSRNNKVNFKEIGMSFIPFLICLSLCGIVGYYAWPLLKWMYPGYADILHGFTYNGHLYIAAFAALCLGICFFIYSLFNKLKTVNLLVAPLFFWLAICSLTAIYLKGAAFFIIPELAMLVSLFVLIRQEKPGAFLMVLLALPAVWILVPFIKMFPVGLGLKMMVTSTLFVVLIFGLLIPVTGFYKHKRALGITGLAFFILLMIGAHFKSGFNEDRPHPTSLVYVLNSDENKAYWATYNQVPDEWIKGFIPEKTHEFKSQTTLSSKYQTGYTFSAAAPLKDITPPKVVVEHDTIIENKRHLQLCITPQRDVNRLEIFTNGTEILECNVNKIPLDENFLKNRKDRLITHYISNNEYTELDMVLPADETLDMTLYESANNLLKDPMFEVQERPINTIPMPFVLNDAVLIRKTIKL